MHTCWSVLNDEINTHTHSNMYNDIPHTIIAVSDNCGGLVSCTKGGCKLQKEIITRREQGYRKKKDKLHREFSEREERGDNKT